VLPLKPDDEDATEDITWVTSPWPLRRERLYALAGDSPLGLRLPLGSLPEIAAVDEQLDPPADPFAPRSGLPTRDALQAARRGRVSPTVACSTPSRPRPRWARTSSLRSPRAS
jgi:uncharacterized protein (DUF2126 family)